MPLLTELITQLLNGLVLGLLYAIIALGFMLILGTMEVINFSHGALFALGGYFALALQPHVGWWAALVLAPVGVGLVGLLLEFGVRRTYGRDPLFGLLFTFGAALALEEVIRIVWGPRGYTISAPAFVAGPFQAGIPLLLQVPGPGRRARRAPAGRRLVVPREDARTARSSRPAPTTARWFAPWGSTWPGCGTWCSRSAPPWPGIAGVIAAPMWSLKPTIGAEAVMPAFIVVVIGGIGSFWGAILGGLMLGLASGLSNLIVPRGSILVMYLLMAVVLLWRPRGLMGQKSMLEL